MKTYKKVDAGRRMARRYATWSQPGLFGDFSAMACWGRIGANGGGSKAVSVPTEAAAEAVLRAWDKQRLSRGYVPDAVGWPSGRAVAVGAGVATGTSSAGLAVALGDILAWSSSGGQAVSVASMAAMANETMIWRMPRI